MSLFYFVCSSFPLALYWLAVAWLHSRSVPTVLSGRRDFVALGAALLGVFFVGPGQLLTTFGACAVWGKYLWALLALLYFLVVVLIATNLRPRLVVYNADPDSLRNLLTTVALDLDAKACWSGVSLNMPSLDAQFYVDASGVGAVASLVTIGRPRTLDGWNKFCQALNEKLGKSERSRRLFSRLFYAALGLSVLAADIACLTLRYDEIREAVAFYLSV